MDIEKEDAELCTVWIDWDKRVVSFQEAKGFEKLEYPTHEEMFQFAIKKTREGFAIQ